MTDDTDAAAPHETLANEVFDHLAGRFRNNAVNGFDVYASGETGAAAVGYRPGILGAQASIRAQVMLPWAKSLTAAGFEVTVDYEGEGNRRAPTWIHVTGRTDSPGAEPGSETPAAPDPIAAMDRRHPTLSSCWPQRTPRAL